jgi:8-oxo-dGTP diphosphatase
MPPADRPVVAALLHPDRYLVTPGPAAGQDTAWLAQLETALASGVRRLQIRLPGLGEDARRRLARLAVALCRKAGVDVLINGDLRLARELETGVHLRAAQLPELSLRPLADGVHVAASCHNAEELRRAEDLGCDFVVLGSVQPSASHPGAAPLGWDGFARLRESVSLPIYAIGGMLPEHIDHARQQGAQGIAAIRGLWPVTADAEATSLG